MQAMRQTPTATNPQTEFGENSGFQQREETTGWPHISHRCIPALSMGSMHGPLWGRAQHHSCPSTLGRASQDAPQHPALISGLM